MSEYKPSKYIMHSGYATVKTYDILTASVSTPSTVAVAIDDTVFSVDINLPTQKGLGWRAIVSNDVDDFGVSTPSFLVPCKLTELGDTFDTFYYGEILRISPSQIRLQLVFAGSYLGGQYSDAGRTFTIKLQPYLSPFES